MRFRAAPLDKTSTIISVAVGVLFLGLAWAIFFDPETSEGASLYFPPVLFSVVYGICYGLKPSAYVVSDDKIIVKRSGWSDSEFKISDVRSIRKIEKIPREGLYRTLGNGGLFGYYGYFTNKEFGDMTWYLTKRTDVVFIGLKSERILLSPVDPDGFIELVNARINQ